MTERYRANAPQTIHQTIEGEVVIINLVSGSYYSLRESGARIWELLVAGHTLGDVTADLRARHATKDGEIERAVTALVQQLTAEGLLVPADDEAVPVDGQAAPAAVNPSEAAEQRPFQVPTLEKFEDMQDLILLDPVHEVDQDAGWPHRPGA